MEPEPTNSLEPVKERIFSIDLLRGIVMMIMLLDHTRDFVHSAGFLFDPTDLEKTTVPLFFTRWITHFCAPTFVFLSGVSIYLQRQAGKTNGELSRFLWTRGLWLIVLEFTVVRFGFAFNLDYSLVGAAQVIWVIGISMIVMSVLIYLPVRWVGIGALAMIVLHNLLDRFQLPPAFAFGGQASLGSWQSFWIVLHQQGFVPLYSDGPVIFFIYPIIPWVAVMAAGWAFGTVYSFDAVRRRKLLLITGGICTLLFIVLRSINIYGDPSAWSMQEKSWFTLLSFLNTTKYPPSLLFLLMTLGPAILLLTATDKIEGRAIWQKICLVYGRVPMFYYILQWFTAHGAAVLLAVFAGKDYNYLLQNPNSATPPPDAGSSLLTVYVAWLAGLAILFPLCMWWGGIKRRHKHWALSYL